MPSRANPGLLGGAFALGSGIEFIVRRRALWRDAAVPVVAAALLSTTGGLLGAVLGYLGATKYLHAAAAGAGLGTLILWLLALVAGILGLGVGVVLGLSLALPVSGPALERIARAVYQGSGRMLPHAQGLGSFLSSMGSTLLGLLVSLAAVVVLTLVGFLCPPALVITVPLKLAILALLVTWDLLDYCFSVRGLSVGRRLRWMYTHLWGALGFGALASLLLCIPVLGMLVIPAAVAGAAHLTLDLPAEPEEREQGAAAFHGTTRP